VHLVKGLVEARLEVREEDLGPQPLAEILPADELSGAFKQHPQDLECLQVDLEDPEADHVVILTPISLSDLFSPVRPEGLQSRLGSVPWLRD
jgi:hypothetical protein